MAVARNGEVELHHESFGAPDDPVLLLINGLGSQCIMYDAEWCEMFAAEGYRVVRFDNRDTGLSSKLEGTEYALADMAGDAVAVLDAVGAGRAHVLGLSMGGMIAQRLAIHHPDRLLTLTSVMSTTGEPDHGQSDPAAVEILTARPPRSREAYIDLHMAGLDIFGSDPAWIDRDATRETYGAAYDRGFHPAGMGRQMAAILADGSRAEGLREVRVPTLVVHGSRDRLLDPSGGRRTAELIPGARYVEIEGMGHDHPPVVWPRLVRTWADFASGHSPSRPTARASDQNV